MLSSIIRCSVQADLLQILQELFLTPVVVIFYSFQKKIEPHLLCYHHSVVTRNLLVNSFTEINEVIPFLLHKTLQRLHEFNAFKGSEGIWLLNRGIEFYVPEVYSQHILLNDLGVSRRSMLWVHCRSGLFSAQNIKP